MTGYDIGRSDCDSVVLLIGETELGLDWLQRNVSSEPWQWSGPTIAVEPRMVADIMDFASDDGLTVEEVLV